MLVDEADVKSREDDDDDDVFDESSTVPPLAVKKVDSKLRSQSLGALTNDTSSHDVTVSEVTYDVFLDDLLIVLTWWTVTSLLKES